MLTNMYYLGLSVCFLAVIILGYSISFFFFFTPFLISTKRKMAERTLGDKGRFYH